MRGRVLNIIRRPNCRLQGWRMARLAFSCRGRLQRVPSAIGVEATRTVRNIQKIMQDSSTKTGRSSKTAILLFRFRSSTSSLVKGIIVQQLTKEKHHNRDTRLHCLSLIPCRYPLRDRTSVSWDSFQEPIAEIQPLLQEESLATIVQIYPE